MLPSNLPSPINEASSSKLISLVPYVVLVAVVAVSIINMLPASHTSPASGAPQSWVADITLPARNKPYVYGGDYVAGGQYLAFDVANGTEIVAPIDGVVTITSDGDSFSIKISGARDEKRAAAVPSPLALQALPADTMKTFIYKVLRKRWSARLSPVVQNNTKVNKRSTVARVDGLPVYPVVLGVKYLKDGQEVPPPGEFAIFTGRGEDIFHVHCAGCHDPTKDSTKPGNDIGPPGFLGFKDRTMMIRLKKPATIPNILSSLKEGSGGMPSFKDELTEPGRLAVAQYLLTR